jgi:hypothetical protein
MQTSTSDRIRATVRQAHGALANREKSSCCSGAGCCGPAADGSRRLGYSEDDLALPADSAGLVQDWSPGAEGAAASAVIEGVKRTAGRERVLTGLCCDAAVLDACCGPAEKPGCCAAAPDSATCGCQTGPR